MSTADALSGYRYPLPNAVVTVTGHLELELTPRGVRPTRLPAWTRAQYDDALLEWDANATAGVRLLFTTVATAVNLEVHCTRLQLETRVLPAVFELVIDGHRVFRARSSHGDILHVGNQHRPTRSAGRTDLISFKNLPPGEKSVELWLPHSAACELIAVRADAPITATRPEKQATSWLHYGSSISHCLEVENPRDTWPAIAAASTGVQCVNLGMAGNAVLDPFIARTIRDATADVISLKIGINIVLGSLMKSRTFLPAVHGFLDTIRDGHPRTPIVLVSPIACPQLESPESVPQLAPDYVSIDLVREKLELIADKRDDPNLHYLDGRTLLDLSSALDMPDGLHPNHQGYRLIGERFATQLREILDGGIRT